MTERKRQILVAGIGNAFLRDDGFGGQVAARLEKRELPEVEVDGVVFRRGGRVVVRPGLDADLQARMLEGRTVTVERIYRDYDGKVHLGVSVDEPGQEIMRETGRFLWFFPPELEVVR